VVPVSSTQVAEMVKLLENTFRMINIGLVNEMALMCDRMGINVWEVIDAAATKPFGFMPFYPGPGLGGHCIPIDPFYLSWKTKQAGIEARFIELAGYINGQMPHFVVDKVQNALNDAGKPVKGSRIHVMGVAYKRNIDDMRESPALDVMLLLKRRGAIVTYSDPHVPACAWTAAARIATRIRRRRRRLRGDRHRPHRLRLPPLVERAPLIVDTRNAGCAESTLLYSQEGSRQRETRVTYDDHKASYLERDRAKNAVLLAKDIEIPPCVHDVAGGLYFLRTLNLEPGHSVNVAMSDGKKSVMAKVEAQQREDVKTPEGTFHTIRYEAYLFDNVLYRRPAHLNIWLTDDRRKLPVQIRVRMQIAIGTINLLLEKHE
jgi:hypothetical protein